MYLKRLDAHGFKSFASTTRFEFGPGVTCIVGPNGSGKTNVADAIRWVLGEHASRVIRARKTEDIIFSGSAARAAMGMAECKLTLDNSDGWLPLDFEEVVVSRRAYRSGENEYFINQSRVRLKDVTDLFLKAQVGQNSYAFMGQGLVEEVLTLRPEERRGLIEEAADVRLHRTKLDEARHRLEATQDNLERIAMLVREIEPRLRQLERQAGRAEVHARLSAELAHVLREWFGGQWQDAQEALTAARAACDQRQEEFEQARRHAASCEEGLASLGPAIEERRRDIAGRIETYRTLQDYLRDLERRIASDAERQELFVTRRAEIAAEIDRLQQERNELLALVGQQEERMRALEQSIVTAGPPGEEVASHREDQQRLIRLRADFSIAERSAATAGQRRAEAEARLLALSESAERLSADASAIEASRARERALIKSWALQFAALHQRLGSARPGSDDAQRASAEAEERFARNSAAVTRRQDEIRTLRAEIDAAEIRLEATQAADVDLPAPDAGVRGIIAAGGKIPGEEFPPEDRIQGLVGMVGELLRVPAGLERAIEAALADSLHAVVVEKQEDALAAVELLVANDLGRATVYPLSDIKPSQPLNLLDERGVIGVASDLVRFENRYRPLVNLLLGRTIIVENLGIGKSVLRRGLGNVVTRDGILLRATGSISAGSAKVIRRAFEHRRDAGELPRELERLRAALIDATAALEREEGDLREAAAGRDARAQELEQRRADLAAAEGALHAQRGRLTPLGARLVALRMRRNDTARALEAAQRALEAARTEAEAAREQAEAAAASLAALRDEERVLAAIIEDRSSTAQARKLAALDAEREALEGLRAGQAATGARVEQEIDQRVQTAARLDADLHEVEARLNATRTEFDQKTAEARTADEELEPARQELEQIESRQRSMTEELAAARTRAIEAERALLEAQNAVQLRGEEIDALRQRMEEEGFATSEEGDIVPLVEPDDPPDWLASDPAVAGSELPPMRGGAQVETAVLRDRVTELRTQIRRLGPVNEQAGVDYAENKERFDYLSGQLSDLRDAEAHLQEAISELEGIIRERFSSTFREVNTQFQRYFETFFGGGSAELLLTKPDEAGLPGVDIVAQPPRKRVRTLNMLSGGERSLTAVALLFALLATHPSPICVLDEVDAALDEANVDRFTQTLRELAERTQFIIITHNRRTIEMADTIYGVSMGEDSTSTVLSLKLSEVGVG